VGWNLLLHNNNVNLYFTDQTKGPSIQLIYMYKGVGGAMVLNFLPWS